MDPNQVARYEAFLGGQVFEVMGFLLILITYVPLQAAAIWVVKHPAARLAAGLPIVPMLPVIINQNNGIRMATAAYTSCY